MKVVTNKAGQKTRTGRIRLKQDTEMMNRANDGKEPWDSRWKKPSWITVPAGTEVEYQSQETRSGLYHTVTYRTNGQVFYARKKTDDVDYGN